MVGLYYFCSPPGLLSCYAPIIVKYQSTHKAYIPVNIERKKKTVALRGMWILIQNQRVYF
jgi:hypothetical protein